MKKSFLKEAAEALLNKEEDDENGITCGTGEKNKGSQRERDNK